MRKTYEVMGLIKGVTYFNMAAILILLHASIAVAQEPARVVQPAIDAGATVGAQNWSPIASDSHSNVSTARPLTLPIPIYPELAVRYRIMGTVKIAVEIDAAGKIMTARALDGPMLLRRSALDAAYKAHFSPAQVGDKPTKTNGVINYRFKLAEHNTEEVIEEVNAVAVKPDPTTSVVGRPAGESRESKVPDAVNPNGGLNEKVSAVPVKPGPAAFVADKPSGESRDSNAPGAVNPKGDKNATAVATITQPLVTAPSITTTYRVDVGDILDVRILGDTSKKSTLVSVLEGGVLDYHLAGDPVVGGMTLEEIRALLTTELKRRSSDPDLRLVVGVRDYASHTVTVSGSVVVPGNKILRREAVPLYVALAEAQPRPDADRVQISCRATGQVTLLSLNDPLAMETLVHPGDVINVTPRPSEFYYIAGFINVPGQKSLSLGITLMQAIMSAGGVSRPRVVEVEIGRQRPDGFVYFETYNLKEIKAGKMKDPPLRPGDRIEVLKP